MGIGLSCRIFLRIAFRIFSQILPTFEISSTPFSNCAILPWEFTTWAVQPDNPAELFADSDAPICYVLETGGLADTLALSPRLAREVLETLIHHFLNVSWGPVVAAGEASFPIEATKGINNYHLTSDGGTSSYLFVNRDQNAFAITSSLRGEFESDPKTRAEFMELIRHSRPHFA